MGLQMSINAILLGGLYALIGIGFSLQWGISGIINLSYGAMVVLCSYLSLVIFNSLNIGPFVSMVNFLLSILKSLKKMNHYTQLLLGKTDK
jgi:branched-subunit amino acid ABC-type transport system permease component